MDYIDHAHVLLPTYSCDVSILTRIDSPRWTIQAQRLTADRDNVVARYVGKPCPLKPEIKPTATAEERKGS